MVYVPTVWEDFPDTDTLVDAARLNHAEGGIKDAHDDLAAEVTRATNAEGVLSTAVAARLTQAQADLLYEPLGGGGSVQQRFLSSFNGEQALLELGTGGAAGAANVAFLAPLVMDRDALITKFVWRTGSVASGNYDVGIYDSTGDRLWSKGSTAWPATNTVVIETVSPSLALDAGSTYYLAFVADNATGNYVNDAHSPAAGFVSFSDGSPTGVQVAASFPLPDPIVIGTTVETRRVAIVLRED